MSCLYCNNSGKDGKKRFVFCNELCKNLYSKNNINKPCFKTHNDAAKYFKRDVRTIQKYENILYIIDKNILSSTIILINCKICNEQSFTSKARNGYCKKCSALGLGKKEQGKIISQKYRGIGNPNYLDGSSKLTEYQTNKWYKLKQEFKFKPCILTNTTVNIDCHHIIPRWFCKLVNIDVFDKNNIIPINHQYHKVIHHLQLDILLLPTLYFLYKKDAHQLQSHFVHLLQLYKVHQFPVEQLQSQHLFQVSRYPGKKKLLHLLPEFLQPFLDQKEL